MSDDNAEKADIRRWVENHRDEYIPRADHEARERQWRAYEDMLKSDQDERERSLTAELFSAQSAIAKAKAAIRAAVNGAEMSIDGRAAIIGALDALSGSSSTGGTDHE